MYTLYEASIKMTLSPNEKELLSTCIKNSPKILDPLVLEKMILRENIHNSSTSIGINNPNVNIGDNLMRDTVDLVKGSPHVTFEQV